MFSKILPKRKNGRDNVRALSLRLCYGILIALAFTTASFGGVEAFVPPVVLMICAVLAGLIAFGAWRGDVKFPRGRGVWIAAALFAWVILWAVLQTLPGLPQGWHHPSWAALGTYLERSVDGIVGVHAFASRQETIWFILYAFVFSSAFILARSRRACTLAVDGFLVVQLLFAVFAVFVITVSKDSVLEIYNRGYGRSFSSTFINRNSYAGFVGMGLCVCMAALLSSISASRAREAGQSLRQWVSVQDQKWRIIALAGLFAFLFLVLVGTQSRGGLSTSLLGVGLIVLIALAKRITWRSAGIGVVALIAVLFAVSNSDGLRRLQPGQLDESLEMRAEIMALNWRAFSARPVLGTGLGTYADIAPSFMQEQDVATKRLQMAHNTYQELLIELGLVGAVPLFVLVAGIGAYALRPVEGRSKILPLCMAGITLQLALHSVFDFTLEIPANVLALTLLSGAACGQRYYETRARQRQRRVPSPA